MVRDQTTYLKPSQIRFTQDSVAGYFQDGGKIDDVIQGLIEDEISSGHIPPIRVMVRDGKIYSFDNRRLYVFRAAEFVGALNDILVRIVAESRMPDDRFTTTNDGLIVRVRQGRTRKHYKKSWLKKEENVNSHNSDATGEADKTYSSVFSMSRGYPPYKNLPSTNLANSSKTIRNQSTVTDNHGYANKAYLKQQAKENQLPSRHSSTHGISRDEVDGSCREKRPSYSHEGRSSAGGEGVRPMTSSNAPTQMPKGQNINQQLPGVDAREAYGRSADADVYRSRTRSNVTFRPREEENVFSQILSFFCCCFGSN